MTLHKTARMFIVVLAAAAATGPLCASPRQAKSLVSFGADYPIESIQTQDATLQIVGREGQSMLQVATGHKADWPGVTIVPAEIPGSEKDAPRNHWDLSPFQDISLQVRNAGSNPVTVSCRVNSPGGDGVKNSVTQSVRLEPNESKELKVTLRRQLPSALAEKLYGMRGYPGGDVKENGVDASHITQLIVFVSKPKQDHLFQLGAIRAQGTYQQGDWSSMSADEFFPMIDRFGQFKHKDWPGKTHSEEELKQSIQIEQSEMAEHPGPADGDQYGGYTAGPQLKATGFFYPTKYHDKWWLVDPEGRLFWSHGVDCVGFSQGATPITDREFYFTELPPKDSPLARFYGQAAWAPHGYYKDKGTYRTFNFCRREPVAQVRRRVGNESG